MSRLLYAQSLFAYKNVHVYEHRSFVWYPLSISSSASSNEIKPSHTVAKVCIGKLIWYLLSGLFEETGQVSVTPPLPDFESVARVLDNDVNA